jgi:hypothetical protein
MAKKPSRGATRDTGKPPREGGRPGAGNGVRDTGKPPRDGTAPAPGGRPGSGDGVRDTGTPPPDGPVAPPGNPLAGLDPGLQAGLNAGVPTPPVEPFLTPEQMQALSTATRDYNIQVGDLDYALGIQRIDTAYQQGELDKQATAQTASTTDDMIRRGLFQSSIRDGALADITGTNATSKARLNDLLTAATIHTDTSERVLGHALDDMRQNYNVLAAQNAGDAGKDQNPWLLEPGKFPPAGSPGATGGTGTTGSGGTTQGGREQRDTGPPSESAAQLPDRQIRDTGKPPLDLPAVQSTPPNREIRDTGKLPTDKPITLSASGYVAAAKKRMRGRV